MVPSHSPELDELRLACFRLSSSQRCVAGFDFMDSQPIAPDQVPESGVSFSVPRDCSFDVSRSDRHPAVVHALRFLDPAEEGSRYVGGALSVLLEALGPSVAAAVQTVLDQPTAEGTQVLLPDTDHTFRVITSSRALDGATVRITVRCLDSELLPDLVDAKVLRVAEAKGLSDRERQVLRLLLRGRGVEDIATMLEIAPRTVKFHQANVLQKLGADSRQDLLRVVL
jgi:DNA-binding CsgD family transcriptional regulator